MQLHVSARCNSGFSAWRQACRRHLQASSSTQRRPRVRSIARLLEILRTFAVPSKAQLDRNERACDELRAIGTLESRGSTARRQDCKTASTTPPSGRVTNGST